MINLKIVSVKNQSHLESVPIHVPAYRVLLGINPFGLCRKKSEGGKRSMFDLPPPSLPDLLFYFSSPLWGFFPPFCGSLTGKVERRKRDNDVIKSLSRISPFPPNYNWKENREANMQVFCTEKTGFIMYIEKRII